MGQCLNIHDSNANYNYCPSTGAALLFSILFALTTLAHIIQARIYRKNFCWVIIMGGLWETAGFITRTLSTEHQSSSALAFPSQLLILLSPLWINAFDYVLLGRMMHYFLPGQKIAGIKARKLSIYFVLLDITSFIIQGIGGSMTNSKNNSTLELGIHIYMGGIGLQEAFILIFTILATTFQRRMNTFGDDTGRTTDWRRLLYTLYATLGLITVRIIYRLVEFSQGVYTYMPEHEAFFYCLEAVPMLTALILYNIWHPGTVLVGPDSEFPEKTGKRRWYCCGARKSGDNTVELS